MPALALADRFQQLGFQVIEGGKSNKLVVLNTPAVAEIFDMEHDNVLRAVRQQQKTIASLERRSFDDHCISTDYKDKRGRWQPCFNLTKLGFLHVASKWDDPLRWLLVLAYDVLERDDADAADQIITDINNRIKELRSRATAGNAELNLPLPEPPPAIAKVSEPSDDRFPVLESWSSVWQAFRDHADDDDSKDDLFGKGGLPKTRAHHLRTDDGRAFLCQCSVVKGRLVEFWIHAKPFRAARMQKRRLLPNEPYEFELHFEWMVSPIIALELMNRERACDQSPLTVEQAEAVLTLLTSGT